MDPFQKFYDRALRFLSFRPRSEKEIITFLQGKKADKKTSEKILTKLKEQNFINDEEFVKWWMEQRTGSRPKGVRIIKMELQQKGVNRETIEKILGDYDIKILSNEGIKKLIAKKLPRYRTLPKQEVYQKLSQLLLRRGFDWETVKKAVDEIVKKEYNTNQ